MSGDDTPSVFSSSHRVVGWTERRNSGMLTLFRVDRGYANRSSIEIGPQRMVISLDHLRDFEIRGYPLEFVNALEEAFTQKDWTYPLSFTIAQRVRGDITGWKNDCGEFIGYRLILPEKSDVYVREGLQLRPEEVEKIIQILQDYWTT